MANKLLILLLLIGCTSPKEQPPVIKDMMFDMDGGTFPFPIHVVIMDDPEKAANYINPFIEDSINAYEFKEIAGYTFINSDGRPTAIWLSQMSNNPEDVAVANHELLHATLAILRFSGIPFEDVSEETYGYQMQHLSQQFYKNLKPNK